MPEISEGDPVVTPVHASCWIGEVEAVKSTFKDNDTVIVDGVSFQASNCVKADQPIRVRVSRECYAESLVALARECDWEPFVESVAELKPQVWDDEMCLHFALEDRKLIDLDPCQPHSPILDYKDDLPQIEGWLEANAESEDDDNSPSTHRNNYDEPRPYLKEWREILRKDLEGEDVLSRNEIENKLGYEYDESISLPLLDYIDDLESELSDCWENQQEYKDDVAELQEELQDVREELFHKESYIQRLRERLNNARGALRSNQERIEEAREYIKKTHCELTRFERKLLKILSPDSDEVDAQED